LQPSFFIDLHVYLIELCPYFRVLINELECIIVDHIVQLRSRSHKELR